MFEFLKDISWFFNFATKKNYTKFYFEDDKHFKSAILKCPRSWEKCEGTLDEVEVDSEVVVLVWSSRGKSNEYNPLDVRHLVIASVAFYLSKDAEYGRE